MVTDCGQRKYVIWTEGESHQAGQPFVRSEVTLDTVYYSIGQKDEAIIEFPISSEASISVPRSEVTTSFQPAKAYIYPRLIYTIAPVGTKSQ